MPDSAPPPRADTADSCLDRVLGRGDFVERHRRVVRAPAGRVWSAALEVTAAEIRLLSPFMAVRWLPRLLRRSARRRLASRRWRPIPVLDSFQAAGFVPLHRDPGVVGGRALVVYGGAGRFWSPAGDDTVRLDSPQAFLDHGRPGTVKAAFSIEAVDHGTRTEVVTETRVVGMDAASRRAFARYWLLIRGPSGLIRRSWLAAIDRRASR